MLSFLTKPTTAIILFSVAQSAQASCIHLIASASTGLSSVYNLQIVDGGKTTCDGQLTTTGNGGKIGCNAGFSATINWPHVAGDMDVTYSTPTQANRKLVVTNTGCASTNCCGGTTPCTCSQCNFASDVGC